MRDVAARTVSRFICGAYIMAFAGLRDSHYDADEVLHPFLQKYGLLTEEEWDGKWMGELYRRALKRVHEKTLRTSISRGAYENFREKLSRK